MLTLIINNNINIKKQKIKIITFIFSLILLVVFTGCTFTPKLTSAQRTAMRTKSFDADYNTVFRSAMVVIENEDYILTKTDEVSGFIKGSKVLANTTNEYNYDISTTVTKINEKQTSVRFDSRIKGSSRAGAIGAGEIDDPLFYAEIFNDMAIAISKRQIYKK